MGSIVKKEHGKPVEVRFRDERFVAIRYDGTYVHVYEMIGGALGDKICSKDKILFQQMKSILQESPTIGEAKQRLVALFHPDEQRLEENRVSEEEQFEESWQVFELLSESLYPDQSSTPGAYKELEDVIFVMMAAYLNMESPWHMRVRQHLLALKCDDLLKDPRDGLWVLRDMMMKVIHEKVPEPQQAACRKQFRTKVQDLKLALERFFYQPLLYANDIDRADEFLEVAAERAAEGKLAAAITYCENAISSAINYLESYYRLAEFHVMKGDFDGAVHALERIENMPMAEKVFAHRDDFYLLFEKLCQKIHKEDAAAAHMAKLNAIKKQYGKS